MYRPPTNDATELAAAGGGGCCSGIITELINLLADGMAPCGMVLIADFSPVDAIIADGPVLDGIFVAAGIYVGARFHDGVAGTLGDDIGVAGMSEPIMPAVKLKRRTKKYEIN